MQKQFSGEICSLKYRLQLLTTSLSTSQLKSLIYCKYKSSPYHILYSSILLSFFIADICYFLGLDTYCFLVYRRNLQIQCCLVFCYSINKHLNLQVILNNLYCFFVEWMRLYAKVKSTRLYLSWVGHLCTRELKEI